MVDQVRDQPRELGIGNVTLPATGPPLPRFAPVEKDYLRQDERLLEAFRMQVGESVRPNERATSNGMVSVLYFFG